MTQERTRQLLHAQGTITLSAGVEKRTHIDVESAGFIARRECETNYPDSLIQLLLEVKGPGYLCDEILRDEDPLYVEHPLRHGLFSYRPESSFSGKKLLDFGCGSGASTAILARMLPDALIDGVELEEAYVRVCHARAEHYQLGEKVRFMLSPDGSSLPPDIGPYDVVILSAVYEHLLPYERPVILALLWSVLKPGGILFLNQTPSRYFPIEAHTTGLPLVNYLPDALALRVARRYVERIARDESWESLLRRGIRGGSLREIKNDFAVSGLDKTGLRFPLPTLMGCHDYADLWYQISSPARASGLKKLMRIGFKVLYWLTRIDFTPTLTIAIQKAES